MRLIDADHLIEVFEEYDMYLWRLPKGENPHRSAFRSQLNWCINTVRDQQTVPHDMKWNPDCEDCLPENINECQLCRQRNKEG